MTHAFALEDFARCARTLCARPLLFELAAAIQYLGRNPRTCVCQSRLLPSFFPNSAEIARGPVSINQFQVPAQEHCRQWQLPQAFFKIHSYCAFPSKRSEAPKRNQKPRVKLPEAFHFRR